MQANVRRPLSAEELRIHEAYLERIRQMAEMPEDAPAGAEGGDRRAISAPVSGDARRGASRPH